MTNKPKVTYQKNNAEFYPELKKRVNDYFASTGKQKHFNGAMAAKSLVIFAMYVSTYVLFISNILSPAYLLLTVALHGFFAAHMGMSIGHDAIHGAYSSNKRVNKLLSLTFNIVGANDYVWSVTHNVLHHTFTNIPHHDADLNQVPILRVSPGTKFMKMHKYQYIYAFFLYPLATITWVFSKDYVKFFSNDIKMTSSTKHPKKEIYRLIGYKVLYYILFLVIPFTVIDQPWYFILLGFVVGHLVMGMTLSVVFQLAHLVKGTSFVEPSTEGNVENTWASHQMYTTANFATKSMAANLLCGGLNFQIEHHLFPKICHIHYRHLAPIVRDTAAEFGLPYIENKSVWSALQSHVAALKKLGRTDVVVSPL